MGDDDSRKISLPFPFPFFGNSYTSAFVNSDGNLTFGVGDSASSDRSIGRLNAGPPRIAPLFTDLDPSKAGAFVRVVADADRIVISWDGVPLFSDLGIGARQTFQIRLFAGGTVEFAYSAIHLGSATAAAGISPGRLTLATEPVSLLASAGLETNTGIAEFFSEIDQVDVALAAQKFYATHEDAYDYLFIFNAIHLYINNGSVIAFEDTVRNRVQGYGVGPVEDGMIFGSPRRLQAVMNMGPMEQYPQDPYAPMPVRLGTGDTGLSVLGHEAGHRFLSWTSVKDDSGVGIMWGRANAHWSFNFNSEASVVEGNRIRDDGAGSKPRFTTIAAAQGYSPLDQYLFGFRSAVDVEPMFAAVDTNGPANNAPPHPGTSFHGQRIDIPIQDVIAEAGVRVPDWTVAQRKYRFGFVLIQSASDPVPQDLLGLLSTYRTQWTSYWNRITDGRSSAEADLRRALTLSFWPSAEMKLGDALDATVTIAAPVDHDLMISIEAPLGVTGVPKSVVIPAGETAAPIRLTGNKTGVEAVSLRAADGSFEVVEAKVRVSF